MFDLNYYNELDEMITLDAQQEQRLRDGNQRRMCFITNKDLNEIELEYLRFRYLQNKHMDYFAWYFQNIICENRTRNSRFELILQEKKENFPSIRRLVRHV